MQKTLKNSGACKHDHDFLSCFCIAMHLHYPCIVNFKILFNMNTIYDNYLDSKLPCTWTQEDIWYYDIGWAAHNRNAEDYAEINNEMCDLIIPDCQKEFYEDQRILLVEDIDYMTELLKKYASLRDDEIM